MTETTVQDLQNKIGELTELIHRQSKIIQQTGQQVLELQIKSSQDDFKKLDKEDNPPEYVTNDDIVQLVGELQGQLDFLELRSIRRTQNATLHKPEDLIAPIPNNDGEYFETFPKTLKDIENLSNQEVLLISDFYDLIPPSKEQQLKLDKMINEGVGEGNKTIEEQLKEDLDSREFTDADIDSLFDELCRFAGLKLRRTAGIW